MPRPDGTPTKKELADRKRETKRRSENAHKGWARKRREAWEASPEGAERLQDASAALGTKATLAQVYQTRGWGESPKGARHFEQQLPGMENPDAVPQHPRWEDLDPKEQARTKHALEWRAGFGRKDSGEDPLDTMTRTFGAQLDQSYLRAERNAPAPTTAAVPYSRDFYVENTGPDGAPGPRGVMGNSARDVDLPFGQYAAVSAITSPNAKFQAGDRYPNDETARNAVRDTRLGADPLTAEMGRRVDDPSKQNEGRPAGYRKAIDAVQQFDEGIPVSKAQRRITENRSAAEKGLPPARALTEEERRPLLDPKSSPKVGPYHNSWLLDTPDYFVSDVHSGGGGFLPHLGYEKPAKLNPDGSEKRDKKGNVIRDKSEREKVIEKVPNFHVAADYAARKALEARGLTSIRQAQASQWGEEQILRKEGNSRLQGSATEAQAYAHLNQPTPTHNAQGSLDFASGQARPGTLPIKAPFNSAKNKLPPETVARYQSEDF